MLAPTHVAFAATLYLGGAAVFEYELSPWGFLVACIASLGPDVDLPTSRFGRLLWFWSTRLERDYGHRTVTHSLVGMAILLVAGLPLLLLSSQIYGCLVGGWWSHIWIDMANFRGVDLLWPSRIRVVMPGNRNWRIAAGSKAEMVLMALLFASLLPLYPLATIGLRDALQRAIGNFDISYYEFERGAGEHWYRLDLTATDNLTLDRIRCDCPVLGTWQQGLIVLHEGRPRAVGEEPGKHNLYPVRSRLQAGDELQVLTHKVDMRGRSIEWLASLIDSDRTHYLLGELRVGTRIEPVEDIDRYRPVSYSGQVLKLHYAQVQDLDTYRHLLAAEGEVYVQFWLHPGEERVELNVSSAPPSDPVPAVLRGYLDLER